MDPPQSCGRPIISIKSNHYKQFVERNTGLYIYSNVSYFDDFSKITIISYINHW